MGGGGDGGAAERARNQELARQNSIASGQSAITSAFSGFTPEYYGKREQSYRDYANPQLQNNFKDAESNLKLRLSSNGLGQSSAGADALRRLGEDYALQKAGVEDKALATGNEARQSVQQLKTQLFNQLNATGDSALAAQAAKEAAFNTYNNPTQFNPITNAFKDYAGLFASDLERSRLSAGGYNGMFNNANQFSGLNLASRNKNSSESVTG